MIHIYKCNTNKLPFLLAGVAKDDGSGSGSDISIGAIVGIICGVIALIIIIAVICVCCYIGSKKSYSEKVIAVPQAVNVNEIKMAAGNGAGFHSVEGSPASDRRLLTKSENDDRLHSKSALERFGAVEPRKNRSGGLGREREREYQRTNTDVDVEKGDPDRARTREHRDVKQQDENVRRSPLLSDLHRNPKFRRSFHENEMDSEDRARGSWLIDTSENDNSTVSYNSRGVPLPPKLPKVPKSPPRSPSPHRRGEKIAMISRDRPLSSSSDLPQQESKSSSDEEHSDNGGHRGRKKNDLRHTLKPDRKGGKSRHDEEDEDSEEERRRRRKEKERERRDRERREEGEEEEERRRRKKEEKRRRERERDQEEDRQYEGRFKKSASGRKSKGKGPRKGRSKSTGNALDDMEENHQRSRSKSPSSVRSLNFIEDDDEDDLDSSYMRKYLILLMAF